MAACAGTFLSICRLNDGIQFTGFYWKKDPNGDWLLDFCSHIFRKTNFFVARNPCLLIGNFKKNQIMADFV
jgi:hypothetical protein